MHVGPSGGSPERPPATVHPTGITPFGSVCVRFPFLPNGGSYFDLFEASGNNLAEAARLLLDLVEDFVDPEMKGKRLTDCEHEGDRVYRHALAELYAYSEEDDRLARHVLTWKDIVDELEHAMDGLEHVADAVSSIVLKTA